jgi:hypothetical protein
MINIEAYLLNNDKRLLEITDLNRLEELKSKLIKE